MNQLSEKPIFVVGFPRSGTTLLRFILSSHPRIFIPAESGFIPYLRTNPREQLKEYQVRSLLEQIGRLNHSWVNIVDDINIFYNSLPEPTLKFILDALYRIKIGESGASRWGDKTPQYILHMQKLLDIFPSAQFIHLIRDCRATTLSAIRKWGAKNWYMDEYYLIKNWTINVKAGLTCGRQLNSNQYLEVHYEYLVQQPEQVVNKICNFLKEDFCRDMLNHISLAQELVGPGGHMEVLDPIHMRSLYHWKKQISPYTLKLAHHIAGPTLEKLGYDNDPTEPFTPKEAALTTMLMGKYYFTNTMKKILTSAGWLTPDRRNRRLR